jgi:hypothetical protein
MNVPIDTLQLVIADLVDRAKERECSLVDALVPEDLERLSTIDLRRAARCGLLKMAADAMHGERSDMANGHKVSARGTVPSSFTADGRNPSARYDALRIVWTCADGGVKELASFTLNDCEALRDECARKEAGWQRKKTFADQIRDDVEERLKAGEHIGI